MRIIGWKIKNFMSVLEAEVIVPANQVIFVEGINRDSSTADSNGSGKSAIISRAPLWILYGQFPGMDHIDNVVNDKTNKNCIGSLKFIQSNDEFEVIRTRASDKYGNSLRLLCNGQDISKRTVNETQKLIERTLGMGISEFCNSVCINSFVSSLNDKDRKILLENLMGIDCYYRWFEAAKTRRLAKEKELLAQTSELSAAHSMLSEMKSKLAQVEGELREFELSINDEFSSLSSLAETHKSKIEQISNEKSKLLIDIGKLEAKLPLLETKLGEVNSKLVELKSIKSSLLTKKDMINVEIANLSSIVSICPMCKSKVSSEHLKSHVEEARLNLRSLELEISGVDSEITAINSSIESVTSEISAINDSIKVYRNEIIVLDQESSTSQTQLNIINSKLTGYNTRKSEIVSKITQLSSSVIPSIEAKISTITESLNVINDDLKYLKLAEDVLSPTGVRSVVLSDVVDSINHHLESISEFITGGEIQVQWILVDDQIKFKVEGFKKIKSAGQAEIVDYIHQLALVKLVRDSSTNPSNLLILDETRKYLDSVRTQRLIEYLSSIDDLSVYFSDQDRSLKSYFDHSITIVLDHGISTLQ